MTYDISMGEIPNCSRAHLSKVYDEQLLLVPPKRDANASIGASGGYSEFERSIETSELFCQSHWHRIYDTVKLPHGVVDNVFALLGCCGSLDRRARSLVVFVTQKNTRQRLLHETGRKRHSTIRSRWCTVQLVRYSPRRHMAACTAADRVLTDPCSSVPAVHQQRAFFFGFRNELRPIISISLQLQ